MKKRFSFMLFVFMIIGIIGISQAAEKVVTIQGTKPYRNITEFMMLENMSGGGDIWYVDSNVSAEGNGTSWTNAKDTVDEAINLCTANNGDVIFVAPGHAESFTAANGFDADVAGITIIMMGTGADAPEFTFADTDATVNIGAASVKIIGGRYLAGISEVVSGVSMEATADDCVLDGLYFPEPSGATTYEFDKSIVMDAGADRNTIKNCIAYSADDTGATNWLDLDAGVQNGTRIENNWIYGEYAEGAIHSDDVDLDISVWGNTITNLTTGQHGIEFTAAALGTYGNNMVYTDTLTASIDPGSLKAIAPNWVVTKIDANPVMFPAQDTIAGNTYATLVATSGVTDTDLFDVDGGAILITSFVGLVTTSIQNQACTLEITLDADAGFVDHDFSTAVDLDNDAAGQRIVFSNANESVLTPLAGADGGSTILMTPWFCGEGMIEQATSATNTGAITWYMTWIPYENGTTVTAQ